MEPFNGPMVPEFAPFFLLFILFTWVAGFVIALVFVVLAARFATRAVLDEIAKDKERRQRV